MVKISIIIPMYNVEQYISKCIESTYHQGFNESEFEIILVDDESPDNSLSLANSIAEQHSNIKIISQKNRGLGGARNTGVQNSKGLYLLFLDADDYLLPNVLKEVIEIASENYLDIIEFGSQGVTQDGQVIYEISKTTNGIIYDGIEYYNNLKYMNSACNKLYKRSLLEANKLFFIEKIYIEDFEFNTRSFFYAKKVMAVNNIIAHYLQSPNSITRNTSNEKKEKMLNDLIQVLKLTKKFSIDSASNNLSLNKEYFETRLSFLNITIFYQLFKHKKSYAKIKEVKDLLIEEKLFFINKSVSERYKDLFRVCFLYNFWIFKITQPLQKTLFR